MVRKAYIEFALPKIGTFTVGKQPVTLGYGLAFSDSLGNLDGLKWSNKWGPVGVSAMYFKWRDNVVLGGASTLYNRDNEIWALDLKYTPNANHAIELFGGYVKLQIELRDRPFDGFCLLVHTRTSALRASPTPARSIT